MLQYVQPLEPYLQRLVHVFYTERSFPAPLAKFVLYGKCHLLHFNDYHKAICWLQLTGESVLVERDIRVWNSKTYADRPVLAKEDQAIRKHRNWYNQFYSDNNNRNNNNNNDNNNNNAQDW